MGIGKMVLENSFIVIDVFKKFLLFGFDRKVVIKFINFFFLIKNGEGFVFVDVVCVDRFIFLCEFLKVGVMLIFIKRGNEVLMVELNFFLVGIEVES